MTIHAPHPDTHSHGLADDCPRCAEHAETPVLTLDESNLRALIERAVHRDFGRSGVEARAIARVLTDLEHAGHMARVAPELVAEFLSRYGVEATITPRLYGRFGDG